MNQSDLVLMFLYGIGTFLWSIKGYLLVLAYLFWFIRSLIRVKQDLNEVLEKLYRIENILNPHVPDTY